ncbi:hypothetical protein HY639_01610 [Candidatus Woesearchaeota archaeon]|nr:hypothetical protein [Candidatus Woesearchaeota archaeon]
MKKLLVIITVIFLVGCTGEILEYRTPEKLPKPVEHIGPAVEKQPEAPYELSLPKERIPLPQRKTLELTEDDLFAQEGWDPREVSVFNITLGDSLDLVLSTLGKPDETLKHPTLDIINLGYRVGLPNVGFVLHFSHKTLDRITIKDDFNPYLHGKTVINYTKKDIYNLFGIPEEQKDLPAFRVFKYPAKGLEILHTRNQMRAFVLTG